MTLRQGEKKHYNNKVDVYSFGIVLWELLINRMPFEGMSNLQAAYAAAFKVQKLANSSNSIISIYIYISFYSSRAALSSYVRYLLEVKTNRKHNSSLKE